MRATRHNGRSGKHGVYNPKHNDRKFDIANSEHIDAEREKQNIYWDCYRGYVQNPSDETLRNWGPVEPEASFHDIEKMYYEDHYSIRMLCRMQNIDEKVLYERAKLILSIYREVCWSTIDRANDVCDTLICTYGDSLDGALIYLENFAPDEARERFEERIRSLFETKWIIELVDMAMLKIREYPDKGALYCEIISKAYLNRFKYKESEMLEVLNMERSTYYDRKKEAILLFGLSLWGTAIPKLKDFLESAREEEALCYCEC